MYVNYWSVVSVSLARYRTILYVDYWSVICMSLA